MDSLRHSHNKLIQQYDATRSDVAAIRDTLHHDVLAQLELELVLSRPDITWLSEWLSDTASIFRILRRHKFVRPFALQEIHSIAIWRLRVLRPVLLLSIPTLFHCLPPPIADPLGRPIVFLKLATLESFPCAIKEALLKELEHLRLHLRYIRDHCAHTGSFPLQYLLVLDLNGVSIQNYNLDVCSWILTDVIPRYPGMFAAVFLLNYSWIHAGAWTLAKRILPSSIIVRVFFPSKVQLVDYCSMANLPSEYGGSLPTLDQIDNALHWPYQTDHLPPPPPPLPSPTDRPRSPRVLQNPSSADPVAAVPPNAALQHVPSTIALPPLSAANPFFGYPAFVSASNPHAVRYVRRGIRELGYTLAVLWWRRWKRWVWAGTGVGLCMVVLMLVLRLRRIRAGAAMTMAVLASMNAGRER